MATSSGVAAPDFTELHADDLSDMDTTDDSSSDEEVEDEDVLSEGGDKPPGAILHTDISTEEEFEGFSDHYLELPHTYDDTSDFMADWRMGSRPRQTLNFTVKPGLRQFVEMPDDPKPVDYFDLFFRSEDYETMAEETNRYFRQSTDGVNLKPRSRLLSWYDTTAEEMKVFIALTIAMGLVVKRDVNDYWSTNDVTSTPFFPKCMPRDRFWILITYLHLSDNSLHDKKSAAYTPINKLGVIYKRVIGRFFSIYKPHEHISVDEGMVPWRGNLSFKVYNPDKPKKYGMKAYMLCDSDNGYVCQFKLYTGKVTVVSEAGKTYDMVMNLVREYAGKGYHLFMDNFYSSPTLFTNLWDMGIGATGTLRPNRKGTPKIMGKKKMEKKQERGDMIVMHNKTLLCVRYQDKKSVVMLSTVEDVQLVDTGRTNRVTGELVRKPRIVYQYNKYMGGVDRVDQMLSYFPLRMKTMKWWKRVWFYVINVALLNAYIV